MYASYDNIVSDTLPTHNIRCKVILAPFACYQNSTKYPILNSYLHFRDISRFQLIDAMQMPK